MSNVRTSIQASFEWEKRPANCAPCYQCSDMMVLNTNVLVIVMGVGENRETADTKYEICNSCLELLNLEG